ncbi:hypothetical protein ABBQ38_001189 [Trebouxia sp. C0009 RCD-2024]
MQGISRFTQSRFYLSTSTCVPELKPPKVVVHEALDAMCPVAAKNRILSAMYPRTFNSTATVGPQFLIGAPKRWRFPNMLAADELSGRGLQVEDSSLQHDHPKWKFIHPEARVCVAA